MRSALLLEFLSSLVELHNLALKVLEGSLGEMKGSIFSNHQHFAIGTGTSSA